jgi:oxygen-independent coproporphyrinogen-3 oxidase
MTLGGKKIEEIAGSDLSVENFFRQRPYRNFFQYPPINIDAATLNGIDWVDELGLEVDRSGEDFTVFVSVPFCRVRCNSCPYFVTLLPSNKDQDAVATAYTKKLLLQFSAFSGTKRFTTAKCRAIYIGGGTASLLSPTNIKDIIRALELGLNCASDMEITLEGNPHEFNLPYLLQVKKAGVNRISIGYQSSANGILKDVLNSPHTAGEGLSAVHSSLAAGFDTVNVDLLYRLPGQTFEQWKRDVRTVIALRPENVTTYEYVVHSKTVTERRLAQELLPAPVIRSEAQAWYEWMRAEMQQAGYVEPSNHTFSKPGHHQRYADYTYGQGCELLGLGVKAYSYINGYQVMAHRTVPKYEAAVGQGEFSIELTSRKPTYRNFMERQLIFGLRRGLKFNKKKFLGRFGISVQEAFESTIDFLLTNALIEADDENIWLTPLGKEWKTNILEAFYDPSQL